MATLIRRISTDIILAYVSLIAGADRCTQVGELFRKS